MPALQSPPSQSSSPAVAAFSPDKARSAGARSYWPAGSLEAFTLRMASHGLCVSSAMMLGDRRYALEQLATASAMTDAHLQDLALALFRHFEQQQAGLLPAASTLPS